jgi:hypothetical protein
MCNNAAGHPADHVPDRTRSGEGSGLAGGDAELLEAVEQVVAAPGAEISADLDLAAAQADLGADRAVGDDLRLDRFRHQHRCEQRWTKPA